MKHQTTWARLALAVIAATATGVLLAAESRPPAGQMCPEGSYVIGFDAESNIVCSEPKAASETPPTAVPPGQPKAAPAAQASVPEKPVSAPAQAAPSAPRPPVAPAAAELAITAVEPRWVVFGTPEVEVTVTGTGFGPDTVVSFEGQSYPASVDPSGTKLTVMLPTAGLPIAPYAIVVTDVSGNRAVKRRALEIY